MFIKDLSASKTFQNLHFMILLKNFLYIEIVLLLNVNVINVIYLFIRKTVIDLNNEEEICNCIFKFKFISLKNSLRELIRRF